MLANPELSEDTKEIDIASVTTQYVENRDELAKVRERHKQEVAPYLEVQERLNATLLDYLNKINAENVKSSAGTVYRTKKASASVSDMESFWSYVIATCDWDLVDRKANVSAVAEHIEKNGVAPPGVNYSQVNVVGVRRA